MTEIRVGDDDGALWLFPTGEDDGHPLTVIDGPQPVFVAGTDQYFVPFLFGVCADQQARTTLYEWIKDELLIRIISALEAENWMKAESFTAALSEADAFRVLKYKRK